MTRQPQAVTYAALLRRDGVARAFTAAIIGRLSYAMISLSLLLTVQNATASYAAAGVALGGYALISFLMPIKSRLIDRFGPAAVLPGLSAGLALCLTSVAAFAITGATAKTPYVSLAVGAGLFAPPLGPSMRAIWAAATPEPEARRRAYSLDGVVEEVLFAVGPLVVGVILLVSAAPATLVATGLLNLAGTLALVTAPLSRRHQSPQVAPAVSAGWAGPLTRPGFAVLIIVLFGVGLAGGPLEVSLVARAAIAGRSADVGYLLASLSVGSAVGGLLWGSLIHRHRPRRHLAGLIGMSTLLTCALIPISDLWAIAIMVFLLGLTSSPLLVTAYVTADDLVSNEQQREASTWVNTMSNVGVALGASASGVLIDHQGPATAFAAGTTAYVATLLIVMGLGRQLSPRNNQPDLAPK